jgi:hemerythrin superfamily protein
MHDVIIRNTFTLATTVTSLTKTFLLKTSAPIALRNQPQTCLKLEKKRSKKFKINILKILTFNKDNLIWVVSNEKSILFTAKLKIKKKAIKKFAITNNSTSTKPKKLINNVQKTNQNIFELTVIIHY